MNLHWSNYYNAYFFNFIICLHQVFFLLFPLLFPRHICIINVFWKPRSFILIELNKSLGFLTNLSEINRQPFLSHNLWFSSFDLHRVKERQRVGKVNKHFINKRIRDFGPRSSHIYIHDMCDPFWQEGKK